MIRSVKSDTLRAAAFVAAVAVCVPSVGMAGEHRPATITINELRQRLLEAHARIHAWYVEYESIREFSRRKPAYLHRTVAAKAPDRFFHWSTHGYAWSDWREDLYQQRLSLTPTRAVIERPAHRQFRLLSLKPDDPLPGSMPHEFLFLALGWWPFPQRPPPMLTGDAHRVVPAIATCPKYVINPRQERVGGRWCHLLEYPGHDRLWLDCDHGCAILAREVIDPDKGVVLQRIESSEHRELQPGIWIPFEFRNMLFEATGTEPRGGKVVKRLDAVLRVLEVRLNEQVQDDVFRFEPVPGAIESIGENRMEQAVPGGTEYLDVVIDWSKRLFDLPAVPAHTTDSATEALLEYGILGGGVVALIGIFFRRCRHPRNAA